MDFQKTLPFKSYGEKKLICKLVIAHLCALTGPTKHSSFLKHSQSVGTCYRCNWRKISDGSVDRLRLSTRMRYFHCLAINAHALSFALTPHCLYTHHTHHTHPMQGPGTMVGALRCLEVHWAIGCTVYLEPASAEGFAIHLCCSV